MTIQEKLEALFDKVRTLPEAHQVAAIEALSDIAQEPYVLSEDELAVLRPALEEAKRGENLVSADDLDLLNKPWG